MIKACLTQLFLIFWLFLDLKTKQSNLAKAEKCPCQESVSIFFLQWMVWTKSSFFELWGEAETELHVSWVLMAPHTNPRLSFPSTFMKMLTTLVILGTPQTYFLKCWKEFPPSPSAKIGWIGITDRWGFQGPSASYFSQDAESFYIDWNYLPWMARKVLLNQPT